ncbi:MAG: hypothetical protein ACJAYB_000160 [Psychromonas sp.]|jgi:hypothetical protein
MLVTVALINAVIKGLKMFTTEILVFLCSCAPSNDLRNGLCSLLPTVEM